MFRESSKRESGPEQQKDWQAVRERLPERGPVDGWTGREGRKHDQTGRLRESGTWRDSQTDIQTDQNTDEADCEQSTEQKC